MILNGQLQDSLYPSKKFFYDRNCTFFMSPFVIFCLFAGLLDTAGAVISGISQMRECSCKNTPLHVSVHCVYTLNCQPLPGVYKKCLRTVKKGNAV